MLTTYVSLPKDQLLFKKLTFGHSLVRVVGGAEEDRTPDPLLAKQVLSQLSYSPTLSYGGPG